MAITALYTGLLAIWFLVLSIRVNVYRRKAGINLGDGGNPVMLRCMRGHANFTEYVPLILVMLAVLELMHSPAYVLHGLGATLLVARLLHGISLSFTENWITGRAVGTLLTYLVLLVAGVLCVLKGVSGI